MWFFVHQEVCFVRHQIMFDLNMYGPFPNQPLDAHIFESWERLMLNGPARKIFYARFIKLYIQGSQIAENSGLNLCCYTHEHQACRAIKATLIFGIIWPRPCTTRTRKL